MFVPLPSVRSDEGAERPPDRQLLYISHLCFWRLPGADVGDHAGVFLFAVEVLYF